ADYLSLGGKTPEEKVELLIKAIDKLKAEVNIPTSIEEAGVSKDKFFKTLDEMSEQAFDDQCTGANPRYPLISEIKEMYTNVFSTKK
ncbi:iron-containing alcohol dehydrogenase, partial [Clostridium botulinum]